MSDNTMTLNPNPSSSPAHIPGMVWPAILILGISAAWCYLLDIQGVARGEFNLVTMPFYGNTIFLVVLTGLCWQSIQDSFVQRSLEVGLTLSLAFMVPVYAFFSPKGIAPEFAYQIEALGPVWFLGSLGLSLVLYLWWFRHQAPSAASAIGGGLIAGGMPVMFSLPLLSYAMSFHDRLLALTRFPASSSTIGLVGILNDSVWFLLISAVLCSLPLVLAALAWQKHFSETAETPAPVANQDHLAALLMFMLILVGFGGFFVSASFASSVKSYQEIPLFIRFVPDLPITLTPFLVLLPCLLIGTALTLTLQAILPGATRLGHLFSRVGVMALFILAGFLFVLFESQVTSLPLYFLILGVWLLMQQLRTPTTSSAPATVSDLATVLVEAGPMILWAGAPLFWLSCSGIPVLMTGLGMEYVPILSKMATEAPITLADINIKLVPQFTLLTFALTLLIWAACCLIGRAFLGFFARPRKAVEPDSRPVEKVEPAS